VSEAYQSGVDFGAKSNDADCPEKLVNQYRCEQYEAYILRNLSGGFPSEPCKEASDLVKNERGKPKIARFESKELLSVRIVNFAWNIAP